MYNKKMKLTSLIMISAFSVSGVGLGVGLSFVDKVNIPNSEKIENSKSVSEFISNIGKEDFFYQSDFDKSITLFDGNIQIADYSDLLITEAYEKGYFKFEVPNKIRFFAEKAGIDVFMKRYNPSSSNLDIYPSYYNSSTPEFNIWFGKGKGSNRVEDYISISTSDFYGFKTTPAEQDVKIVSKAFGNSIKLKPEFYSPTNPNEIKDGIFAKNIKVTDIISNLTTAELNGVNWNIVSVSQDAAFPDTLNINIDFNKGIIGYDYFQQTYQKFQIKGFPIEQGIDDNISKVKNFIAKGENTRGLGEAFTYTKPKTAKKTPGTVVENYQAGLFNLELPFSFENKARNAGVEYIFKNWVSDEESDSVFPDEQNSTIPKFKIYIKSGAGTPLEYEESFVVKGMGQVTNIAFDKTPNNIAMEQIRELSQGVNDFFKDKINLSLIGEFLNFESKRGEIMAESVASSSQKNPEDNLKLTLDPTVQDSPLLPEGTIFELNIQGVESKQDRLGVKLEIFIGTEYKDKASFLKTVYFPGFAEQEIFNQKLIGHFVDAITTNSAQENLMIVNKNPIIYHESFVNSIKMQDGFYFQEEVFVGYDKIMERPEYQWTNKPSFKIDFSETMVVDKNIKFKIVINTGINTKKIDVIRTIDSFFK